MPAALKLHKVLSLPGSLDANAIYFVDLGATCSLYVTDTTGAVAHSLSVPSSNIVGLEESVDDRVATLIQNGTGITWVYDDIGGTLTPSVSLSAYSDEQAQDAVGGILVDTSTIDLSYNDGTPSITASVRVDSIDNTLLSNMPAMTLKGNNIAGPNDPIDLVASQVKDLLAITPGDIGAQPLDATLTALAGVNTAADQLIYSTGVDTFAMSNLTTFARTILDDANAGQVRNTLGIGVIDIVGFGGLVLSGYLQLPIVTITGDLTLNDTHHTILCNTAGGSIIITLPTAAGKQGRIYRIKKLNSANTLTLVTTSAQTIDNSASRSTVTNYETVVVQSDNANWWVI